ncbi:MAG: hypothetical protein A2Z96_03975 [Spirochaetes bacterium GWB1_48_6]|nr:MAG: hypothetical protein A2Z96_03975 [Spirochaetes bacterium GWB1_48_6]
MKKWAYVLIPSLAVLVPLILSFDEKVGFYQFFIPYLISTTLVGLLYLIWDALVVIKGHWKFNDDFVGTWRFFHLPLGEYLFFFFIPYSCLFLYEVGRAYFGSFIVFPWIGMISQIISIIILGLAFIYRKKGYSFLALVSVALFFQLQGIFFPELLGSFDFLFFIGFSTLGFLLVDGIYTSLPTIFYNPQSYWNIRIFSIPLEDFLYNLSHLGLILIVYLLAKSWFRLAA